MECMAESTHVRDVTHNLRDLKRDRLALRHDALHRTRTNDVSQCRLRALDERLAKVGDTKGGAVRVDDLEVDDGVTACVANQTICSLAGREDEKRRTSRHSRCPS
jgi:hypothetical protein